jgi:hypothetical protein
MVSPALNRRHLLGGALAATTLGLAAPSRAQSGLAGSAAAVPRPLVDRALAALARHEHRIWSRNVVAIADFGQPSAAPRFHLVDLIAGTTTTLLVAHGKGSDPDHTGLVQRFSDAVGSNATSEGAYLTGETYSGVHGLSRRLIGLDHTNANAEDRAIVIHAAWYADPALLPTQGRLGRSDGCFVFSEADIAQVLARLGRGRLLYAGKA